MTQLTVTRLLTPPGKRHLYILLAETDQRLAKVRHNLTRIYRSEDEYGHNTGVN